MSSDGACALREWRVSRGLSLAQLSKLLDVPTDTLSRWELGRVVIRHERMLSLALSALDVELED